MSIPEGATHKAVGPRIDCWYKNINCLGFEFMNQGGSEWIKRDGMPNWPYERIANEHPKPWSGPEDGLPPVGLEVEIKIDFKKAPPYAIITLTELGVDVQNHTPRFQNVKVLYASSKYLVAESCGAECLTPMSCVEIRAIRTPEQLAADTRETAIRELMDIAQVDCRVTAARLVDAGFKR